ncbi:class I SAM-dependent methyltransferase [Streptosporangium sp. NBC_01755]|uniref:class I SAM-dependent methyltransferase n=1 Tax=unclassified Streptosporangium TaxID=2632669 RepID=UPI002DDB8344|nr:MULTISPECIES: class I SAM-dependent methyltransferase [unclassified Streptosporangium]WSA24787.1 class I SAM-dependent methyltransferase [Streptosporangium sp. NBC_01810]WSC97134.1 class I SAM-dependent methyltransferase [Streptosporangium sp. NBC_01755]
MTTCRLCGSTSLASVIDLGATPPCERFLTERQLEEPEVTYPLHLRVCTGCWLAQIPPMITPEETFTEYAYFSSYSTSWVEHAREFVDGAVDRLGLGGDSFVVEVASNDGYLLRHVVERGIRCLGVEPSENVGQAARDAGVPTLTAFLGLQTGASVRAEHGPADLVVANNVYAHIPDVIGFTRGLRALVADDGWVSIEVQHLLTLMAHNQYDTIYHEHFQYYTVASARSALAAGGLSLVDVESLPTHGGSIRLWARPTETAGEPGERVAGLLAAEKAAGLHELSGYTEFGERVARVRRDLLTFLLDAARQGRTVVGYGAPGKGNTLLNHCGIRPDLLPFTVDRNPYKHGRFTPGTRIPILPPERLAEERPDYVLVLPWNLREELADQLSFVHAWGGRLVFPIPNLEIVEVNR